MWAWRDGRLAIFAMSGIPQMRTAMPTRNISLTVEQNAFVQKVVDAGEYQNASEAVRDALRALQQRRREDRLKLKNLRAQVNAGIEALERGEFAALDDATLDGYVARLGMPATRRVR
jgi:antitoxin ParD1/3/4